MKENNNYTWIIVIIIILITLHLKVFSIFGFDVGLGVLLLPYWLYLSYGKNFFIFNKNALLLFCILFFLPFITFWNIKNIVEFFKTYSQFVLDIILIFFFSFNKKATINKRSVKTALTFFLVILTVFVTVQYCELIFIGDGILYNIWGSQQLYYQLPFSVFNIRAKGFYLEPSYLALVTISCYWSLIFLDNKISFINFALASIILSCSVSAFGLFAFLLINVHFLLYQSFNKSVIYRLVFWGLFTILTVIVVLNWDFVDTFIRLSEISNDSDYPSGYIRYIAPLDVMRQIFIEDEHYLGVSFGQVEAYSKVLLINRFGEDLSNSFYLFLGYFGIIALLFYISSIYKYFSTKNIITKSYIVLFALSLLNSGAFITAQNIFLTCLLPMLIIKLVKK